MISNLISVLWDSQPVSVVHQGRAAMEVDMDELMVEKQSNINAAVGADGGLVHQVPQAPPGQKSDKRWVPRSMIITIGTCDDACMNYKISKT
ncbi:hypothetical protein MY11210_009161 [Beauveria gryllotalpidicola]